MSKLKTPFELFNVECGKGWDGLLKPIFDYIERYNNEHEEKIEIIQVKEKFGGLRFYTNFTNEELESLIKEAESKSFMTCEICGSTNNIGHTLGWITTCCEDCVKKMATVRKATIKWKPINCNGFKFYEISEDGTLEEIH